MLLSDTHTQEKRKNYSNGLNNYLNKLLKFCNQPMTCHGCHGSSWLFWQHRLGAPALQLTLQQARPNGSWPWDAEKNPRICRMQQTKSGLFATYSTGRMLSLTPGTQKLPHPNGTQGYPRPSRSYHCKAFPKPLWAGFWLAAILTYFNEVRTRCERGPNYFGRLTP